MEIGWVPLWRKIRKHWTWKKKPFSAGQAWVDLIIRCNFEDGEIPNPGRLGPAKLKPGQAIVSLRGLEATWGWNRPRIIRFLHALRNDTMIVTTNCYQYTLVNLLNYNKHAVGGLKTLPPDDGKTLPPPLPGMLPGVLPILRRREGKKRNKGNARAAAPAASPQGAVPTPAGSGPPS